MINILDKSTQVNFEKTDDIYKYSGTCNIKDNNIIQVNVTVYTIEYNYRIGDMSIRDDSGISISLVDSSSLSSLPTFATILNQIKSELEDLLLTE